MCCENKYKDSCTTYLITTATSYRLQLQPKYNETKRMYKSEKENCYKPVVDMNERRSSQGLFFA